MGAKSRRKGAVAEREVVGLIRGLFPNARRRVSGEESQGGQGRDIDGTPGFCIQVNHSARPPIERKLNEAAKACRGEWPLAFTKRTGGKWLVTMHEETFHSLIRMTREHG